MKITDTRVIHYGHSSVAVETNSSFLIFDYYYENSLSEEGGEKTSFLSLEDLKTHKDIYVFVSHSHGDHFNQEIFQWQDTNPNIRYILSHDIKEFVSNDKYYYINSYESLKLGNLEVKTFGTTDKGVSFLVHIDGLSIFHAGDLNWWHWKNFTSEEQKREELDFKREIGYVLGEEIDIAFIPVDPRLEEFYYLAGEYFVQKVHPKLLVPIHFREDFSVCKKFADKIKTTPVKVAQFYAIGDSISLSNLE